MGFDAGSITSKMTLDNSGFIKGMHEVQSISRLFPGVVQDFLANPLLGLAGIAKSSFQAIKTGFLGVMEEGDRIGDLADNLAITAAELDGLGRVAKLSGSSFDSLGQALQFLQKNAGGFAEGEEGAVKAFDLIGVAALNADGHIKPTVQLFKEVADAIAELDDPAAQMNAAMDIFGRGAGSLVATLRLGSKGIEEMRQQSYLLGQTLGASAATGIDKWDKLTTRLDFAWTDIKRSLAEPLADALTPILNDLLVWIENNPEKIKSSVQDVAHAIAAAFNEAVAAGKVILPLVDDIARVLGAAVLGKAATAAISYLGSIAAAFTRVEVSALGAAAASAKANTGFSAGAAMATGGALVGSLLTRPDAGPREQIGSTVGGLAGGLAGGKAGGAIGAAVGGPWGAAIGSVVGFIGGSTGGTWLGGKAGQSFDETTAWEAMRAAAERERTKVIEDAIRRRPTPEELSTWPETRRKRSSYWPHGAFDSDGQERPADGRGVFLTPFQKVGMDPAAASATSSLAGLSAAAQNAERLLNKYTDGLRVTDTTARQVTQQFNDLLNKLAPALAPSGPGDQRSTGERASDVADKLGPERGAVLINTLDATVELNIDEATTRMAEKLRAAIKPALERKMQQLEGAVFSQRVMDSMR